MFDGRVRDVEERRRRFSRRAILLGAGQTAAFGLLAAKLYQLQVMEGTRYAPLADDNRLNVQLIAPERGRILDRYGLLLAGNEEGFRAVLVPSLASSVARVIERLSKIITIAPEDQERLVNRARRQQPNISLIVASDLSFEQIASINLLAPQLPGVQVEPANTRWYPAGDAVGHVVGHVGSIERIGIDDDAVLRLPGFKVGRSGVERGMDDRLRGRTGAIRQEVDGRGRIVRTLSATDAGRGEDVVLAIDTDLQRSITARLSRERRASCVAIHIASGDVVAMVSVPAHDPGDLVRRQGSRSPEGVRQPASDPVMNRTIRGLYPPGSTFKMVTALAALDAGVIDLDTVIDCEGRLEYGGQTFRCWKRSGHGRCAFHRALKESCDCYFYEIARRVGIDAIASMGRRLGLGQTFDMGLAHQKSGLLPDPAWKRGRFNQPWLGGETLLAGIGQGYVLATPLQLAVMTARLASGRSITPQMVHPDASMVPPAFGDIGLRPQHLDAVRRAMAAVVNEEGGTGSSARLEGDQLLMAGKTGTSQVSRASSERKTAELDWEQRDHALFVAYAPAARPRYAVSVVIEHGGGGGATAGPVMRDVISQVLARDPGQRPSYQSISIQQTKTAQKRP